MSGIRPHTVQADAKAALYEAARVALADELVPQGEDNLPGCDVSFGFTWPTKARDWFAVTDTVSNIDPANVGPRRQLDETVTITVSVGSWVPTVDGDGQAAEVAASDRAFDLLARVQTHIRLNDVTLGGLVFWCLPGSSESAAATFSRKNNPGRLVEVSADFVCTARTR